MFAFLKQIKRQEIRIFSGGGEDSGEGVGTNELVQLATFVDRENGLDVHALVDSKKINCPAPMFSCLERYGHVATESAHSTMGAAAGRAGVKPLKRRNSRVICD